MDKIDQMNLARAIQDNCESRPECEGCAFHDIGTGYCMLRGANPVDWELPMKPDTIEHVGYDDTQCGRDK